MLEFERFATATWQPLATHDGAPMMQAAGGVVHLRLNRPVQHNRLDPADVDALAPVLASMATDRSVRVVLLTGTGDRTFSSGYTLQAIASELDLRFERMLDTLESLPQVTIAAFNGHVYGGATDLALCCDIRLGFPGMRLFMPAARFGLHYYSGGLRRYINKLGLTAASKLFLTAMTIEADEMLRIGFLTEMLEREALPARVEDYLKALEQTDPVVVGEMKRHLRQVTERTADYAQLDEAYQRSLGSAELKSRLNRLLKS